MDWKEIVKAVAPVLGTALGGPLGGLAAKAIGDVLGVDAPTQDNLKALFSNNPTQDQLIAVKNADQDFALKMRELGFNHEDDIAKLNAQVATIGEQDRDSARHMQMALNSAIVPWMAVLVTIGFFGLLFFMLFYPVPAGNKDVLNNIIGSLGTAWIMVVSFYFGTSLGSQNKDILLAQVRQDGR